MSVPSLTVMVFWVFEAGAARAMEESRNAGRQRRSEARSMKFPQSWTRSLGALRVTGLKMRIPFLELEAC
jgi:hypothetical protein